MQIPREVAQTEVWLNEQERLRSPSLPEVRARHGIARILGLLGALLLLAGISRADSLRPSLADVSSYLAEYSVLPITQQADMQLSRNILLAQSQASYGGAESLLLSEDAVLRAISLYAWADLPISSADAQPVVWAQSLLAINPDATVSVWPESITFAPAPVSTPEPSVLLLLVLGVACLTGYAIAKGLSSTLERTKL